MNIMRYWLLAAGLFLSLGVTHAQDDRYLDDAYMSRKDIEKREAKAKAEAEIRRQKEREARQKWEAEQARLLEEYRKRQRDREIDAYNGRISSDDSLELLSRQLEAHRIQRDEDMPYYGEYSYRLARFYGRSLPARHYGYWGDDWDGGWVSLGIHLGPPYGWGSSLFYPWYDSWYGYDRWYAPWYDRWHGYSGWYDPWYYPYRWSYGGYWAGYYDGYWGGGIRYRDRYENNYYRGSARHNDYDYRRSRRSVPSYYERFQSARGDIERGGTGINSDYGRGYSRYSGSSTSGSSYRGVGRSSYGGGSSSNGMDVRRQESRVRSYDSSSSNSSYDRGSSSSSSSSGRSGGGSSGGGQRGRR